VVATSGTQQFTGTVWHVNNFVRTFPLLTIGLAMLFVLLLAPAAGRFADVFGVARVTTLAFLLVPPLVLALAVVMRIAAGQLGDPRALFLSLSYLTIAAMFLPHPHTTPGTLVGMNPWVGFSSGVAPLAGHLFILYFAMMSIVTPPVALAAYAAFADRGRASRQNHTSWCSRYSTSRSADQPRRPWKAIDAADLL
jgi:hypothetical protein